MAGCLYRIVSGVFRFHHLHTGQSDAASDLAGEGLSCGGASADAVLYVPEIFKGRGDESRLYSAV